MQEGQAGLAADEQTDEHAKAESSDNTLGGILADVVFGRDTDLLGHNAGVAPLLRSGFLQAMRPIGRGMLDRTGCFRGSGFELADLFAGDLAEMMR